MTGGYLVENKRREPVGRYYGVDKVKSLNTRENSTSFVTIANSIQTLF